MIREWLRELSDVLHVNILAYDYTGYGLNENKPSEEDCFADIEAAFDYAIDILGIPEKEIVLWGRSLGSGFREKTKQTHI